MKVCREWRHANPIPISQAYARAKGKRRGLRLTKIWNDWFPNSHLHHFTKHDGIYVPVEWHTLIRHNIWTGKGMAHINLLALLFYVITTPDEKIG